MKCLFSNLLRILSYGCLILCFSYCQNTSIEQDYLFELKSYKESGIDFSNDINPFDSFNIIQYLYAFNGAGVAIGDINNDQLADIYFTSNQGENKLYLNMGGLKFENITNKAGVGGTGDWSTGVNFIDINADGLLDIYVCQVGNYKQFDGENLLYINQGDLRFVEKAEEYNLNHKGLSTQSAFLDYDLDGDLDMYLLCHSVHAPGNYSDTSLRRIHDPISGDRLFRNDGLGFSDQTFTTGIYSSKIGYGLGIGVEDFNNDSYPDIYISNDFHENDYLYINQTDGAFKDQMEFAMVCNSKFSMGFDIADINNDGSSDLLTLDMKPENELLLKTSESPEPSSIYDLKRRFGYHHQFARNMLHVNRGISDSTGVPQFTEIAQLIGLDATDWSWSALLADFDSDGWNDAYISNGILFRPNDMDYLNYISNETIQANEPDSNLINNMPDGKYSNYMFKNHAGIGFENVSDKWMDSPKSYSNGASYADLDNDGDLDIVVNNINEKAFLYENTSDRQLESAHFLRIKLHAEDKNPFAISSKLKLWSGDIMLSRSLSPTRGFMSCVDYTVHFGLGKVENIDSLEIIWPNGLLQVEYNLKVDTTYEIAYNSIVRNSSFTSQNEVIFKDISSTTGLGFNHKENNYNDEDKEPLIPYHLSREGPALAVGDVNNDGIDDIYLGGAFGQNGALFIQDETGQFKINQEEFWADINKFEDVDAEFIDIDNDQDLDLFIASGGNHLVQGDPFYADRLYINDGTGNYRQDLTFFETNTNNSSCVAIGDINNDGIGDILVGVKSIPGNYGLMPRSQVWLSNRKGNLMNSNSLDISGMINDIEIFDINNDGLNDVVVAGEWMPITIFWNINGKFEKEELEHSSGFWNTLKIGDLDKDGFLDIIAGNLGLNTHLKASPQFPLTMYTNDFDKNGSIESIICHYKNGRSFPIYHKDQLSKQLNPVKKKFIKYDKYANSSIEEVLNPSLISESQKLEINELSSCIFYGSSDGFQKRKMDQKAQYGPIRSIEIIDINNNGLKDIIAFGNKNDFVPMIGMMSSQTGYLAVNLGNRNYKILDQNESGFNISKVCTHSATFRQKNNETGLILAINNDRPIIFSLTNE